MPRAPASHTTCTPRPACTHPTHVRVPYVSATILPRRAAVRRAQTMTSPLLLEVADFLADNAVPLVAATVMFALFCGITCLFTGDDGARSAAEPVKGPVPKWFVLRIMNYCVLAVFISSMCLAFMNRKSVSAIAADPSMSLFPYLVLWSACLAYFFGFFGISFVDKTAMERSPSSFGLDRLAPMNDAPICAEKPLKLKKRVPATAAAPAAGSAAPKPLPSGADAFASMTDEEVVALVEQGSMKDHQLETKLGDHTRAVRVRRRLYERRLGEPNVFSKLPVEHFDYERIFGANCEIVVGYVPLPCGVVGPLLLDNEPVFVPMATTEGCLVASTNRGCKAITASGGASSVVMRDGITRAPCLLLPSAREAARVKAWCEDPVHAQALKGAFESTTSFGKLVSIAPTVAGRNVYLRCTCFAGDAMGMNMVSKGCLAVVAALKEEFPEMGLVAISGNVCCDKKPAAINWIEGRGKSVVVEATIRADVVKKTLKTSTLAMVEANRQKCLIGSAMAASVGGFNAHAANIVAAAFLATGQDPAQVVESANCITLMEPFYVDGQEEPDLYISVTMPSLEVGTVGGGTSLPAQRACLEVIGCAGASRAPNAPGTNAKQCAKAIAAAVLAGELSLMAALSANQLMEAHLRLNRKK